MNERTESLRQECERILSKSKTIAHAVAVHDYETGIRFSINADRPFHAASTIKVAILLAIVKAIDDGRIRPNDTLHVRNRFRSAIDGTPFRIDPESDGYPELHKLIGRTAKISDLTEWMIVSSSNLATNILLDFITVEEAQKILRAPGVNVNGVDLR
ncbi:MAG TPA: serine hydrolase, partial [Chthoniobacterales bacterium]